MLLRCRPKDIKKTEAEDMRQSQTENLSLSEDIRLSQTELRRRTTTFIPEHVTRLLINFVPTHPTGIAIFRAIPGSEAMSAICPWNDTELKMQESIRDHLGFGGLYKLMVDHSGPQILEVLCCVYCAVCCVCCAACCVLCAFAADLFAQVTASWISRRWSSCCSSSLKSPQFQMISSRNTLRSLTQTSMAK